MKRGFLLLTWAVVLAAYVRLVGTEVAPEVQPHRPREMLLASVEFSDRWWDESAGLLWSAAPEDRGWHRTRESAWYALGLLMRNGPGDDARAFRILDLVLAAQYRTPGQRWDGTFQRSPEEPPAGPGSVLWKNYDPNWRLFIGTTFALILTEFEPRLPAGMAARLEEAIRLAVVGELQQGRDEPYHTNILLMHGFLWSWAGARFGLPDWVSGGEAWAERVAAGFDVHETFEEYNSPTYYGVDLYGLALWRKYGATEKIRQLGTRLEAGLWRDIGRFYHAGLKNLCGPYDRAYGMDMRRYVSLTGAWMGLELSAALTPLPDPSQPMDHAHDFAVVPAYVLLGAQIPEEVLASFRGFSGERVLRRPITATRTATAWLSDRVMIGGEITGQALGVIPGRGQFHPATIHWLTPEQDVGWVRLYASPPSDAEATERTLSLSAATAGDFVFRLAAPGLKAAEVTQGRWALPGLEIRVEGESRGFAVETIEEGIEVRYEGATRLVLRTSLPAELPGPAVAGRHADVTAGGIFPIEFLAGVAPDAGAQLNRRPVLP